MSGNVNVKIIRKIRSSCDKENIQNFLIDLLREEFARYDLHHWQFQDIYDRKIEEYLEE